MFHVKHFGQFQIKKNYMEFIANLYYKNNHYTNRNYIDYGSTKKKDLEIQKKF